MTADIKGLTPYTVAQQKFSYLQPRAEIAPKYTFNETTDRERLRYLESKNIPLVAYACLCKGGYEMEERMPEEFLKGETRYSALLRGDKVLANELFEKSKNDAMARYKRLKDLENK